jgi:hypothetical protein
MLELIVATLMSIGFNVTGEHFVMNSKNADIIRSDYHFKDYGGDENFKTFVQIDPNLCDDIVITDSVDPEAAR